MHLQANQKWNKQKEVQSGTREMYRLTRWINPMKMVGSDGPRNETDHSELGLSVIETLLGGEAPLIDPDTLIGFGFVEKHQGIDMKKTIIKRNEYVK